MIIPAWIITSNPTYLLHNLMEETEKRIKTKYVHAYT